MNKNHSQVGNIQDSDVFAGENVKNMETWVPIFEINGDEETKRTDATWWHDQPSD